jgi:hypothetical protein
VDYDYLSCRVREEVIADCVLAVVVCGTDDPRGGAETASVNRASNARSLTATRFHTIISPADGEDFLRFAPIDALTIEARAAREAALLALGCCCSA